MLKLRVAFDEFFRAATGKSDGEATVVFVAFDADNGANAVFGMANSLAEQGICIRTAADRRTAEA